MERARQQVERAQFAGDLDSLLAVADALALDRWRFPDDPLVLETEAYALFRAARVRDVRSDPARALDYLKRAERAVARAVDRGKGPRAAALLAAVISQEVGDDPLGALREGPRARRTMAAATAAPLRPSDAIVWLLKGEARLAAPAIWPGGLDSAEHDFRRALELASHDTDAASLTWVRAEGLAYLGLVLKREGQDVGAKRVFLQALSMPSSPEWVRDTVFPAVSSGQPWMVSSTTQADQRRAGTPGAPPHSGAVHEPPGTRHASPTGGAGFAVRALRWALVPFRGAVSAR